MNSRQLKAVSLEINNRCNIHCTICDHPVLARSRKPLPTSLVTRALADARSLGARQVTFSGGEPLLHPGIDEVIAQAKGLRLQVTLISNGILLTSERIEELLECGVNRFVISCNGDADIDDAIRGHGVHKRAMLAIRYLLAKGHGARLTINVTVCRTNLAPLDAFVRRLRDIGVRSVTFSLFSPDFLVNNVAEKTKLFALSASEVEQAMPYLGRVDPISEDGDNNTCHHVLESCVVESDGSVSPCWNYKGDFNLYTQSLADILRSDGYLRHASSLSGRTGEQCKSCYLACYNLVNSKGQQLHSQSVAEHTVFVPLDALQTPSRRST